MEENSAFSGILFGVMLFFVALMVILFTILGYDPKKSLATETTGTPAVICLDPGHPPNGAGGEPAINLRVALDVQKELEGRGYTVIMTRTNSNPVSLDARPAKCLAGKATFMYSFHADGTPRSAGYPYQIYMKSSRKLSSESKKDASIIQDAVAKEVGGTSGLKDGGTCAEGSCTAVDSLAIFSGADSDDIPAVLTEMVQLSGGHSALDDSATREKLVTGIANGIQAVVPLGSTPASSSTMGTQAVAFAEKQIGKPYVWAAAGPSSFDCSGLMLYVYKKVAGINLPHSAAGQYTSSLVTKIKSGDELPGDLVFFGNPIHHVGIVIGGGQMVEAPHTGASVRKASYRSRGDITGFARPKVNE